MRRIHWILAVAVTVFALSLSAVAQPPGGGQGPGQGMGPGGGMGGGMMGGMGGGQGPGGGMGMMLGGPGGMGAALNPQYQEAFAKELGLTPLQATELQRVMQASGESMRTRIQTAMTQRDPNAGQPNPQEMRQQFERLMDAGLDEMQANVNRVLTPAQRTKLSETTFQLSGGLTSPAMGSPFGLRTLGALDLTDAQKEQYRRLVDGRQMPNFEGIDGRTPEGRQQIQTMMDAANARFAEQIKGILTPEQRAKVEKLTAETPALRERMGIPSPEEMRARMQQQQQPQRPGQGTPGGGFVPGQGAWQPGQGAPPPAADGQQRPQRGGFPRGEN